MDQLISNRNLTIVNFTIVAYFMLIGLIDFFNTTHVVIGVFREILTIPFLMAQIVFLVIGIVYLIKKQLNTLAVISVLSLAVCTVMTIGSFF